MPDTQRVRELKKAMDKLELPYGFICVTYMEQIHPDWKPICKTYFRLNKERIHPSSIKKYEIFQKDPMEPNFYLIPVTTLYMSWDDLSYKMIIDVLDATFKPPQVITTEILKVRNIIETAVDAFFKEVQS